MLSTFLKSNRFLNSARSFSSSRLCYSVYAQHNEDAPMHALQARLGLASIDSNAFKKALTHQSFAEQDNHEAYKSIGKRVTGLFVTEFFHCKYPNLHPQAFEKTISAYIANKTFAQIATELGMQHSIKWTRTEKLGQSTVLADCLHAVIGAVFEQDGEDAAKKFVHDFILAREMDIRPLIKMDEPKRQLSALLRQLGKSKAESRLLSETGRHSSAPVFVVGVFSETEKLGEGFGSSIKMAEFRACQDALINHYGKEQKEFTLPSDAHKVEKYVPAPLGITQAIA